jgi:zinc transport system substrate-binding protein
MRKLIITLITVTLMLGVLGGCNSKDTQPRDDRIQIVTTIFPIYDWVINVLGENREQVELTMLLDTGADLHNYQPTAADIMKIHSADIFIYIGGESDEWVEDVMKNVTGKEQTVISLMTVMAENLKEEEIIEGMEQQGHDEDETEYDEHIWLSLRNAAIRVNRIKDALIKTDRNNSETYRKNRGYYIRRLNSLDARYQEAVTHSAIRTLLFADRFPFRYLTEDYGLQYYAAFTGCSAESEASFETISFLSRKVDELSLKAVMTIEGSDKRIAETVIRNTSTGNRKILTLNSMQSVTSRDVNNGTTYLSLMEDNLSVLKEALQ